MSPRAAVVGGGVAGIVAAWDLSRKGHDVVLLEADGRLGGHTHTVDVEGAGVDTGFIVCNDRNYPLFHRFLAELGCAWRWSDMSFGYHDEATGLQYAGTGLGGLLARPANAVDPRFWSLLSGAARFASRAGAGLDAGTLDGLTLGDFIARERLPAAFVDHYLLPMGAAIWSAPLDGVRAYPAAPFLRFFRNHGLLGLKDRPRWQTVAGGSRAYLEAFRARFTGELRLGAPVKSLRRLAGGGVELDGERFDLAIVAAHADDALALLADPSPEERRLLGAWRYQDNRVVLHHDESFMPPSRRAWASWNYRRDLGEDGRGAASLTYDMVRLQGLRSGKRWLVTLNPRREPRAGTAARELSYRHPVFDFPAIRSQAGLAGLNGLRSTWFCGSYFGHGFHEDAVRSAVEAAASAAVHTKEVLA